MKESETSGSEREKKKKSQGVCWSFWFLALRAYSIFVTTPVNLFLCQNAFFKNTAGFLFSDFHGQIQTHLQKITAIFSSTPVWAYSITIVALVFRPAFSLISVPSFLPLGRTRSVPFYPAVSGLKFSLQDVLRVMIWLCPTQLLVAPCRRSLCSPVLQHCPDPAVQVAADAG